MANLVWKRVQEQWDDPSEPEGFTYRARVPGGWLVSVWAGDADEQASGGGVAFVPDPTHGWELTVPDVDTRRAKRAGKARR